MKTVYVVHYNYASVYNDGEDFEQVFDTYEKAKKAFDEYVKEAKENDYLLEEEGVVVEETEKFFSIYKPGEYNKDHLTIEIREKRDY